MTIIIPEHQYHHHLKKGILLALLAYFLFVLSYLLSKIAAPSTTVSVMLFFRGLVGSLLLLPWMLKDFRENFKTQKIGLVFVRALSSVLNTGLVYLAIQKIPLVDATLLSNTAPIFVPFIAWAWVKTPLSHKLWFPILVGFVGIILILKPNKAILNEGALYGLAAGFFTGVSLLAARFAAHKEKIQTALFYMFFIGWILVIPFALLSWKIDSFSALLLLVVMGVLSTVGQWLLFKALQYGKASHIAPFGYVGIVYAGLFDWFLYSQAPDWLTILGVFLVSAGGIVLLVVTRPKEEKGPS